MSGPHDRRLVVKGTDKRVIHVAYKAPGTKLNPQ